MVDRERSAVRKAAVALGSLGAFLVAGELGARLAGYGPDPAFLALRSDPDLQLVPLPDQSVEVPEPGAEPVPVRINAHGQRGADYPLEKEPGELRVVALGDSLTFGKGVRDGETWPARLGELYAAAGEPAGKKIRVVNAAFNGYSTFHYRQWARTRMARFDPDVVLVGLFLGNDMEPVDEDFRAGSWADLMRQSALRHLVTDVFRRTLWKRARANRQGGTVAEVERELDEYRGLSERELAEAQLKELWSPALAHLAEVQAAADARGVRTACVLIPTSWMTGREGEPWVHAWLRAEVAALGMAPIAPLDALRAAERAGDDPWLAHDRGHLAPAGHALLARAVADGLALEEPAR